MDLTAPTSRDPRAPRGPADPPGSAGSAGFAEGSAGFADSAAGRLAATGGPADEGSLLPALAPLAENAVLARRGLFSAERTLDADGDEHSVRRGGVAFGRVDPMTVGRADLPPSFFRRTWAAYSRHVLLYLPFDLTELPEGHRYAWVSVRCALEQPPGHALQLKPGRRLERVADPRPDEAGNDGSAPATDGTLTTTTASGDRNWDSDFTLLTAELAEQVRRRGSSSPPTEPRPLVTTFGQGRTTFGWRLDGQPGYPLWYQNVIGGALIELPKQALEVAGVLTAQAVVLAPFLGGFQKVPAATTEPVPFRVPLPPHLD